jgi:peptide/nickel transport system permease protein
VLAIAVGLPLGTLAARRRGRWPDRILSAMAGLQMSMPVFVIGTLLILLFAQTLRWVPAGGFVPFSEAPLRHLVHLSMPAFTIAVGLSAVIFRMVRTTVIETMERDWVRTAHAKGLARKAVLRRHVVRNALGPVLTVVGLSVGTLLGGTVLVEYVFNWPGLSGFLVGAVEQRDYPAVQSIVLVISFLFIMINLVVDLLYSVLDPRIRHG